MRPIAYVGHYQFHEIIVYEPGGFFKKHTDTMIELDNKLYDYTLILLPPNNYTGGELIIYDKNNQTSRVVCDENNWKWVIFHKQLQHECKPIITGYKIIIKFHVKMMADYEMYEVDWYESAHGTTFNIDEDVIFNPMATGVPT